MTSNGTKNSLKSRKQNNPSVVNVGDILSQKKNTIEIILLITFIVATEFLFILSESSRRKHQNNGILALNA